MIPESADELSGKDIIAIAGILHSQANQLSASLKALRILSGMNKLKFYRLSGDVKLRCLEHVQWLFDELEITVQLLPKYKKYYGPSDELNNFTLAEFHFAERYYSDHLADQPGALEKLIAVLYRKGKLAYDEKLNIDGDIRMEFNANVIDYYSLKVAKWPMEVKWAILLFYDGCRKKISDDNEAIFSGGDGSGDPGTGMYGVMRGLAGPKFGDLEKVEKMYLHTALLELNLMMEEQAAIEAKYKT